MGERLPRKGDKSEYRTPRWGDDSLDEIRDDGGIDWSMKMLTLVLWILLAVLSLPLAILALVLWPVVWLISLPLRLVGVTLRSVFDLIGAIIALPARLLRGPQR